MTTIITLVPPAVATPRAAPLAAQWFTALLRSFHRAGAARAVQAGQTSRAKDAEALRRYAQQFQRDDPRFAADLFAAADRHESEPAA